MQAAATTSIAAGSVVHVATPEGAASPTGGSGDVPPIPGGVLDLKVTPTIRAGLDVARQRAHDDATSWLAANPAGDIVDFTWHVARSVGDPPTAAGERRELQQLHAIAGTRTERGNEQALWLDKHGLFDIWQMRIAQMRADGGADAAARAERLIATADQYTSLAGFAVKDHFMRQRPHQVDPSLDAIDGINHASGFSFPSGHAAVAHLSASLLASVDPEAADRYRHDAEQVAFSRNYAGVHFPSDVAAGAYIGTAIAEYVLQRSARSDRR